MTWSQILAEAPAFFSSFPLAAYSEYMPPPWVAIKPADPARLVPPAAGEDELLISEYEEVHELLPGLARIAARLGAELVKLAHRRSHQLSHGLLDGNPAWPAELAEATAQPPTEAIVAIPLALSRTQDDRGRVRWTLFGGSHHGAAAPMWRALAEPGAWARLAAFAGVAEDELSALGDGAPPGARRFREGARAVVTFTPFAELPAELRRDVLAGRTRLIPAPASLIFFHHPGYARLAAELPWAEHIPLLHLFPRSEDTLSVRIPQSGWLDEHDDQVGEWSHGHRMVRRVVRTHRWQRAARHETLGAGAFEDKVSVALFSADPDDLGLYGKPMARNAHVWSPDYRLLLDGPRAGRAELEAAAKAVDEGGRWGYRFLFPPMRAGARTLFWHRPLIFRADEHGVTLMPDAPLGTIAAESDLPDKPAIHLRPRVAVRPGHADACAVVDRGHATRDNARRLLEARDLVGSALPPGFARRLLHLAHEVSLDDWLGGLPAPLAAACLPGPSDLPDTTAATFAHTATRGFEESLWRTIASLAEGDFREKDSADAIPGNAGKTGGPRARAAGRTVHARRDLDRLADHLLAAHAERIAAHGMTGRAIAAEHRFRWDTDFPYPWSQGWARNQHGDAAERNLVVVIPGRDPTQPLILGDHYDTAYMEDVYDADRGGDGLRAAAAGADDNHSATATLLLAADALLPLARAGRLERDVWLVHLTGEEFPADCLGARALVRALVQHDLVLHVDGRPLPRPDVRPAGAVIMDMIGHNAARGRDVFQIAPGEGEGAMRLALAAHRVAERWNRAAAERNHADRAHLSRAARMPDGSSPPPPFAHLRLTGEVRPEWDPRSALYNTDGQIFSDAGIPVVLFMENYDISREGYHDTQDTMKNIDLDYCAAIAAIAIETAATFQP